MVSCSVTTAIFAILLVTAYSQRRPAQRRPVAAAKPQAAVAFTAYDFDPSNVKLANIQKKATADPNIVFPDGTTPLHILSNTGNIPNIREVESVIEYLIDTRGADVNKQVVTDLRVEYKGYTPLHYAAVKNRPRIIKALIDRGADPTIINMPGGRTPFLLAKPDGRRIMYPTVDAHDLTGPAPPTGALPGDQVAVTQATVDAPAPISSLPVANPVTPVVPATVQQVPPPANIQKAIPIVVEGKPTPVNQVAKTLPVVQTEKKGFFANLFA